VLHDGMPYDPIQGQGNGGLKVAKVADFEVYSLCQYTIHAKKLLIVILENNI